MVIVNMGKSVNIGICVNILTRSMQNIMIRKVKAIIFVIGLKMVSVLMVPDVNIHTI